MYFVAFGERAVDFMGKPCSNWVGYEKCEKLCGGVLIGHCRNFWLAHIELGEEDVIVNEDEIDRLEAWAHEAETEDDVHVTVFWEEKLEYFKNTLPERLRAALHKGCVVKYFDSY